MEVTNHINPPASTLMHVPAAGRVRCRSTLVGSTVVASACACVSCIRTWSTTTPGTQL